MPVGESDKTIENGLENRRKIREIPARNGPENAVKSPCNPFATALQGPCTDLDPCRRFPISRCGPFNHHSPLPGRQTGLEGESANQGRSPRVLPVGGQCCSPSRNGVPSRRTGTGPHCGIASNGALPPSQSPPSVSIGNPVPCPCPASPPSETSSQSRFPAPEARFSRIQALEPVPRSGLQRVPCLT